MSELLEEYSSGDVSELARSIKETESALAELEKMVERARMDFEDHGGRLKFKTRFRWTVKDSKSLS